MTAAVDVSGLNYMKTLFAGLMYRSSGVGIALLAVRPPGPTACSLCLMRAEMK